MDGRPRRTGDMTLRYSIAAFQVALLLTCLFSSHKARSTAVEDSVQAAVNGAVSAHQRAQALISAAYRLMDTNPAEALGHAHSAVTFAEHSGNSVMEHDALRCSAQAEERLGLFAEFMRTTLRTLQLAQVLGDQLLIAQDLQDLSTAYRLNAMSDKAVEEARNALAMVLPTQDQPVVDNAQRFLIFTLLEAGRHGEVLTTAEHCIQKAREQGNTLEEARISQLIGETLLAQDRFADAFTYLTKAERSLGASGTKEERFALAADMAEAFIGAGRTKEAERSLMRAGELLMQADTWNHRYRLTDLQYQLAVAQGHWQEALALLKRIKDQTDSVNMARLDMQVARMQVTYQLDRKEQVNAQLRDENARHAELIAGQKVNTRYLLVLLAIFGVLVTALFFTSRHSLRMVRRMNMKNAVIRKQHDEIHAKNLELQRQNLRLAETLLSEEEKEMMIKEIHHRVKNNLQVVDSLLHIQGMGVNDPDMDRLLKEAQGRIRSMAMVHEHIYRSSNAINGSLQQHLEQLVRNILVAHGSHDRISVSVDAPLSTFDADTLMPLTLVVNELFTNSVKYAFKGRESGRVNIVVRAAGAGYELLFTDDGVGLGVDEPPLRERSFGLELVRMLAGQLNGDLRFLKGAGTTVSLTFVPDRLPLRAAS
ncbi:MAG TPA: histidine kinase dimerization/phosphoacceptor domain -containing protein [Flavobacteriales bacterium]|nr:histidine kinase dimerization/phosphoacceptor domain -containing protein [Flavobacteriales bacterium]